MKLVTIISLASMAGATFTTPMMGQDVRFVGPVGPVLADARIGHTDFDTVLEGTVFTPLFPSELLYRDGECGFCNGFAAPSIPIYVLDAWNPDQRYTDGFPLYADYAFAKVNEDDRYTEIELRSTAEVIKIRIRPDSPVGFDDLLQVGTRDSSSVQERLTRLYERLSEFVFTDDLEQVPPDLRADILRWAHQGRLVTSVSDIRHTRFRGGEYLSIDADMMRLVGYGALNSGRFNQSERIVYLFNESATGGMKLLDVLKEAIVFEGSGINGVHVSMEVRYRNFVTESTDQVDSVDIYVDADVARDLYDFNITTQEFADAIFVIVDGNRIRLDMTSD